MTKRPYVRLDAGFMFDAKVLKAGEQSAWLYVTMLCLSASLRSDGIINATQMHLTGVIDWQPRLAPLIEQGMVIVDGDNLLIPKWDEWQKTQADYAKEAERKRVRRMSSGRPADIRKMSDARQDKTRKDNNHEPHPIADVLAVIRGDG